MKKSIILLAISMILIMTFGCSKNEANGRITESNTTQNIETSDESSATEEVQEKTIEDEEKMDFIVLRGLTVDTYTEVPIKDGNYQDDTFQRNSYHAGLKLYFDDYTISRIESTKEIKESVISDLQWKIENYFTEDVDLGSIWGFDEVSITKESTEIVSINGYNTEKSNGILHFINTDREAVDVHYYGYAIDFNDESVVYLVYNTEKENVEKGKSTLDEMVNTFRAWESTDVEYED